MRPDGRRVLRLATPLKLLIQRFAFVLLVGAALALLVLDRADSPMTRPLKTWITDAAAPFLEFVSQPAATVARLGDNVEQFFSVYGENARLRQENERLMKWQTVAQRLEHENDELRSILHVVPDPRTSFVSARVIADSGGAFVRTALVNAGARDGVAVGQAVVNGEGLVGRVVETGRRTARVLLLTDLNSRIPVAIGTTHERAILAGDNTDEPRLVFLDHNARIETGDRVVTLGQDGMFPPGLPIGVVSQVQGERAVVQPFVEWHRLEFVSLLSYVLPGMLPATRRAERIGSLP